MPQKLERIYDEVIKETKNFTELEPKMISENPQRFVIFRLILNMDQRTFGNMINKSQGTVYTIEKGLRKSIDNKAITKVLKKVENIKEIPQKKSLLKRYSEIAKRGKFFGEYARKMSLRANKDRSIKGAILKPPTLQEEKLINALMKEKISFKFHGRIEAPRKFVVDFVFPSGTHTKVILEMKQLNHNFRKRQVAIEMAYKALKIRQKHKKMKLIAVIDGKWEGDAIDIIKEEYAHVLLNVPMKKTIKTIKMCMNSLM